MTARKSRKEDSKGWGTTLLVHLSLPLCSSLPFYALFRASVHPVLFFCIFTHPFTPRWVTQSHLKIFTSSISLGWTIPLWLLFQILKMGTQTALDVLPWSDRSVGQHVAPCGHQQNLCAASSNEAAGEGSLDAGKGRQALQRSYIEQRSHEFQGVGVMGAKTLERNRSHEAWKVSLGLDCAVLDGPPRFWASFKM